MVVTLDDLTRNLADNGELFEMSRDEGDDASLLAIDDDVAALEKTVEDLEFRRMFNQPADPNNCFIDIQAGAAR